MRTHRQTEFRQDAFMLWEPDESVVGYGVYNDAANDPAYGGGLGKRHGKSGGIMLGMGGHVEFMKYDAFQREQTNPQKNRLWCYPATVDGR
jgi:hypothetical protein